MFVTPCTKNVEALRKTSTSHSRAEDKSNWMKTTLVNRVYTLRQGMRHLSLNIILRALGNT